MCTGIDEDVTGWRDLAANLHCACGHAPRVACMGLAMRQIVQ